MIEGLNPQQQEAVQLPAAHALVLAGAGSGKTRVLTTRIAWLIQTGQVSPGGVLAVTFTNKSARELLARLTALLPINTRCMWVGTFHGLCNRLLRAHHRDANLPQTFRFSIARISWRPSTPAQGVNIDDEKFPPRDVQRFINAAKRATPRCRRAHDPFRPHGRSLRAISGPVRTRCCRLCRAVAGLRALQRNGPVREHYSGASAYSHHEFQDTNALQYKWICLLAGGGAVFA